jgi:hypothetical protein
LKDFYITEETTGKAKRQPTDREKRFVNCVSDKGLISEKGKELNSVSRKQSDK